MKINVEGVEYGFPEVDSLTMDEAIMLERYSGVGVEELIPGESVPMGAIKALVVIAIMRANPKESEREVAARIGAIKLGELNALVEGEEPVPPSPTESEGFTEISGAASNGASETSPAAVPLPASGGQHLESTPEKSVS